MKLLSAALRMRMYSLFATVLTTPYCLPDTTTKSDAFDYCMAL